MTKKISTEVLTILGNCTFDGHKLFLPGDEPLPRPLYEAVNKVLVANGGKWNRSAKAHVFDEPAEDAIEQALITGEFRSVKQELGQFDTPQPLAARAVELAEIRQGQKVFEPQAGLGNIVAEIITALGSAAGVFANEIDSKRADKCRSRHFQAFGAGGLSVNDFLTVTPSRAFDRVVMNPPFARQADIDHVSHALKFVKAGGRLVSIMSASVRFRTNRKTLEFRERMDEMGAYWEDVDPGAFRESGTMVNSCILAVNA
jgi:predicted RNA methylase